MKSNQISGPDGGVWGWKNIRGFAQSAPDYLLELGKTYDGICAFSMGTISFAALSNPDYVREVLVTQASKFEKADKDKIVMGRLLGRGLVTSDGDFHKRQRKLSQPAFRKKRISMYANAMLQQTERMLDTWEDGQSFDVSKKMNELTMYIVTETLFHMDVSQEAQRIGEAIEVLQHVANQDFQRPFQIPRWLPVPSNIKASRAKKYLDNVIFSMINARRQEEADGVWEDRGDLLSALLQAEDEEGQRMTDEQLCDELMTLFVAGHETTSNALAWTWYLLSQHPQETEKLYEELDRELQGRPVTIDDLTRLPYTHKILKESLRLFPPAWTLNARCALEDVEIDGYTIPKGTYVFISPYALHRDPKNFENPETFDPERFSAERESDIHRYAYIPFGAGHRVCIGNSFAMMEAALILARIAQEYRLVLQPGHTLEKLPQITMSPKNGIQVTLEARSYKEQATPQESNEDAIERAKAAGCPFHQESTSEAPKPNTMAT